MGSNDSDNFFEEKVTEYIHVLELLYLQGVEGSDNKSYAKAFYRKILLTENKNIPWDSIYFNILAKVFLHSYRLKRSTVLYQTFSRLSDIKKLADSQIFLIEQIHPDEYLEGKHYYNETLEYELVLMGMDYPDLVDLLANYLAIKILLEKYPQGEEVEPFSLEAPLHEISTNGAVNRIHEYTVVFSDRQQSLAMYFLLEHMGIRNRADVNMSDVARFLHLLSNQPITKMDNSAKYGVLKKLFKGKATQSYLSDLEIILPYFQKLDLDRAVRLISQEIEEIKENLL